MGVPATAAAAVIDVYDGQRRASDLDDIAQERYHATVAASNEGFLRLSTDVRARTSEQRAQIVAEVENLVADAVGARGTATAAAAAGGVAGQSVAETLDEVNRQATTTGSNLSVLQRFRELAAGRAIESARVNTDLRNLGALPAPINVPNLTGEIFKGIAATFQASALKSQGGI